MEIFDYDKRENLIKEIRKEIQDTEMINYAWDKLAIELMSDDDEKLIDFALTFLLSNIDQLEEYFYEVK